MVDQRLIDEAVVQPTHMLRIGGRYRRRVIDELTDHVTATAERLVAEGHSDEEAVCVAVQRLGPADTLAAQYAPLPGPGARWAGVSFFAGIIIVSAKNWAANHLHEHGGRLGKDLGYSAVWLVGWLGIIATAAPFLAVITRYAAHVTVPVVVCILTLGGAAMFGASFRLTSDGTITNGPDASTCQLAMIGSALAGAAAHLAIVTHRGGVDPKPIAGTVIGITLVAIHYTTGSPHDPIALIGIAIIAASIAILAKDRNWNG